MIIAYYPAKVIISTFEQDLMFHNHDNTTQLYASGRPVDLDLQKYLVHDSRYVESGYNLYEQCSED